MAGISGVGVAVATTGAVLLYAAFVDQSPLAALRDVAGGRPKGKLKDPASYTRPAGGGGAVVQAGWGSGPFPALVTAVGPFMRDKYSQARRWQPGYSDCSSFVGKGLKSMGIDPGASTTISYLASRDWHKVARSDAGAGDIAVSTAHMVLFTGPSGAVGQQNPRRNVQQGTPEELMSGAGSFTCLRYAPGGVVPKTPPPSV